LNLSDLWIPELQGGVKQLQMSAKFASDDQDSQGDGDLSDAGVESINLTHESIQSKKQTDLEVRQHFQEGELYPGSQDMSR